MHKKKGILGFGLLPDLGILHSSEVNSTISKVIHKSYLLDKLHDAMYHIWDGAVLELTDVHHRLASMISEANVKGEIETAKEFTELYTEIEGIMEELRKQRAKLGEIYGKISEW